MANDVLVSKHEKILEVTINRPEKYNAINLSIAEGLLTAATSFAADDELRVMLIRSTGKYFSAGADINSELVPSSDIRSMSEFRRWFRNGKGCLHPLFDELEAIEKSIVVAHQGPCLGGALELSLSCDFRLAAASAHYALPEITLGSIPGSGGLSRLTRVVGPHWARWFLMANLQMSAEKALAAGLIHDVYPDDLFEARVREFCTQLAKQPPETVAVAKLAIELVADLDRAQGRNLERLAVSGLVMGTEFRTLVEEARARLSKRRS
jgi:enoyl-CoA hydratase